jgi:hypothetical protein
MWLRCRIRDEIHKKEDETAADTTRSIRPKTELEIAKERLVAGMSVSPQGRISAPLLNGYVNREKLKRYRGGEHSDSLRLYT